MTMLVGGSHTDFPFFLSFPSLKQASVPSLKWAIKWALNYHNNAAYRSFVLKENACCHMKSSTGIDAADGTEGWA